MIAINGGIITAFGNDGGAGICCGTCTGGGNVTINGGNVTAKGGWLGTWIIEKKNYIVKIRNSA